MGARAAIVPMSKDPNRDESVVIHPGWLGIGVALIATAPMAGKWWSAQVSLGIFSSPSQGSLEGAEISQAADLARSPADPLTRHVVRPDRQPMHGGMGARSEIRRPCAWFLLRPGKS